MLTFRYRNLCLPIPGSKGQYNIDRNWESHYIMNLENVHMSSRKAHSHLGNSKFQNWQFRNPRRSWPGIIHDKINIPAKLSILTCNTLHTFVGLLQTVFR